MADVVRNRRNRKSNFRSRETIYHSRWRVRLKMSKYNCSPQLNLVALTEKKWFPKLSEALILTLMMMVMMATAMIIEQLGLFSTF